MENEQKYMTVPNELVQIGQHDYQEVVYEETFPDGDRVYSFLKKRFGATDTIEWDNLHGWEFLNVFPYDGENVQVFVVREMNRT